MKHTIVMFAISAPVLLIAPAAHAGAERGSVDSRITKYCDPVCELQAQDSAYSMLIEAYRQFQSRQIQIDYEARLRAAAGMSEEHGSLVIQTSLEGVRTLRAWVEALARKERDLRMEQLYTRVANFNTAYACARKLDEELIEADVPTRVDPKSAATKLKSLRIVALGSPAKADFRTVKSTPARKLFLDTQAVEVPPDQLIEPCD